MQEYAKQASVILIIKLDSTFSTNIREKGVCIIFL